MQFNVRSEIRMYQMQKNLKKKQKFVNDDDVFGLAQIVADY